MDLFTACLTTPIKTALHWYVSQKNLCKLMPGLTIDLLEKIPGQINDKRTMMGELNWIFTSITDTIAWNVLDNDLFQKLFRQDSFVADLFRNFLLAQRIMKSLRCTPVSHPAMPSTHDHPLWESWDLALDMCISQLPHILSNKRDFISCDFFPEQIEIFDMWLRYNVQNTQRPPEQLPIVLLQVRNQYRSKSLELLAKFLDCGPWAVSAALSVGIFPYVFKLLTAKSKHLRPLITFIWAKIIAVDKSCQSELIEYNGHFSSLYFINVLADTNVDPGHKVYSIFVLSCLVDNYHSGQESVKQNSLIALCTYLIGEKNSRDYKNHLLRKWCCICLGLCWQNYPEARWEGVRNKAHEHLIGLISDPVAEVRAAAIFALGTYIGCALGDEGSQEQTNKLYSEIVNALIKEYDMVYLVRKELIVALFNFVNQFLTQQTSTNTPLNEYNTSNSAENIRRSSQSTIDTAAQTMPNNNSNSTINMPINNTSVNSPNQAKSYEFVANSTSTPISKQNSSGTLLSSKQQQENARTTNSLPSSNTIQSNFILTNKSRQIFALFTKVWNILIDMQNDPYPEVAELSQKVVTYFVNQANNFETLNRMFIIQNQGHFFANNSQTDLTNKEMNPIKISTEFVPWCCKYFLQPLLPTQCNLQLEELPVKQPVDIYSVDFLDQNCKLFYNHKVKHKIPNEWWHGQSMEEISQIKHASLPIHCKFHPYDDLLFVVDEDATISTYDYLQTKSIKYSFSNGKTRVTSFKLINCQHEPMFLTGTKDCVVRLFKPDLIYFQTNKLITAFIAFNDNHLSKESDLIIEWDEPNEILMCAGDTGHIRVWDMTKELFKDYATQQNSCVSSLSTHENYTVAGFGDGTIKLFDLRKPNALAHQIRTVSQHKDFVILNVKIHKQTNKLITASKAGDLNVFDLRNMKCDYRSPLLSTKVEVATVAECHPYNELIAV
jgi:regulatory associated protein of mTOR